MHVETDLLKSEPLSLVQGNNVWIKMENQQKSGSFKYRGISLLCQKAVASGCTALVSSSGGNAGLAAAFAAKALNIPITVYTPETIRQLTKDKLVEQGATVIVHGKIWDEANKRAQEAAKAPGVQFIHPFDHPVIWEGHSSIITESKAQLQGVVPDVVVISVGGGGLMNGVLEGLRGVGWSHVPLVAMETVGADSLNACVRANDWVEIPGITSVAKCLGARKVSKRSFEWLKEHQVISEIIQDNEAVSACVRFADDHNVFIPPACGATLASVYSNILSRLVSEGTIPTNPLRNVLLVVCGGSGVDKDEIEQWRSDLNK